MSEARAARGRTWARPSIDIHRRNLTSAAVAAGLILLALFALPVLFGSAYITEFTAVAIYSITALGFGLLYGRVGMISLDKVALLSIGVGAGTRLAYATSIPFPLLLIVVGAIVMAIGVLVGLTAIRLSGLYLALVTLMFACATVVVLSVIDFPNGGGGFTGHTSTAGPLGARAACAGRRIAGGDYRLLPLRRRSSRRSCSCSCCSTSQASPGARGRRSARASRPRSPRA